MSAFRGLLTGYLGAKIADTEAADKLKGEVLASAGKNFYTNILPNQMEAENVRRDNYDLLAQEDPNLAELADINGFTASEAGMEKFEQFRKENKLKGPDALKNLNFETDYNTRYTKRGKSFEEKYEPILNQLGIKEIGGMGYNTVESLIGDKQPGQMKSQDMATAPAPEAPQEFASTKLSDYFDPMQSTVDLGTPLQVDQAISGFRKFNQGIITDSAGNFAGMELFGEKNNERNAFKAVMSRIGSNYVIGDTDKADLTATAQAADKVLYSQTQGVIGNILDNYKSASTQEKIRNKTFDINRYNASGFSKTFNDTYKTDDEKQEALVSYMFDNLQTRSERLHFAESFAANIKDSDGDSYRNILLIAIDPTLVIQDN
jgi:hypothetical protein